MYYLIYTSTTVVPPTEADLAQILLASDRNNDRDSISGLLLYHDGSYVQMLEGTEADVERTFERVAQDPRHYGVRRLGFGNSEKRYFPDWRMAFEPVYDETVQQAITLEDAGDFISKTADEHLGVKLLRLFYQMKTGG